MRVVSVVIAAFLAGAIAFIADVPSASAGFKIAIPTIKFPRPAHNRCAQGRPAGPGSTCSTPCGVLCTIRTLTHPKRRPDGRRAGLAKPDEANRSK
jgi:hypothetical protein